MLALGLRLQRNGPRLDWRDRNEVCWQKVRFQDYQAERSQTEGTLDNRFWLKRAKWWRIVERQAGRDK